MPWLENVNKFVLANKPIEIYLYQAVWRTTEALNVPLGICKPQKIPRT